MPGCCWNKDHRDLTNRMRAAEIAVAYSASKLELCESALNECLAGRTDQMTLPFVVGPAPRHEADWVREAFSALPNYPDNVDWKQMGVGGDDSWGARTHAEYTIRAEPLEYSYLISPLKLPNMR